ncbi:MAG: tripartite tricarboxylate transporter substrate-binding protein, partial [Elioraea tepidiphila]
LSGAVNVASFNMSEGVVLMREGKIRCLGQASPQRWSAVPDVPTFREQGFDVVIGSARGIVGPPGFPPEATRALEAAFAAAFADPTLAVLTGPAASPEGGLGSGRWRTDGGTITLRNLWTSVIEFNLFLRREVALALGGFDERMGPGTPWGSAEGNDLVARAIRAGHRALYDPDLRIVHPDKRLTPVAVERARLYGAGLGVALRRHAPGIGIWLPFLIRPLGGLVLAALKRNHLQVAYYLATFRGRLAGFVAREAGS